ncbi:MAG TPA: YigZ family protein [Thermoanaerobaculia bacterium]|nr:YigZ family protein [Thermoanaerobaculia bacterium]
MRVPARAAEAELREKGSVFLAQVRPVEERAAAEAFLEEVRARHPDATHHCFAWRLGPVPEERSSDAGEPMGTAGMPMLQVLRGAGLTQVVAVVVRWFGGVKLGKGGLARAYARALRLALEGMPVVERLARVEVSLRLPYEKIGAVKRLLRPPEVELVDEEYGAEARLVLSVVEPRREALLAALADLGLEPTADLR